MANDDVGFFEDVFDVAFHLDETFAGRGDEDVVADDVGAKPFVKRGGRASDSAAAEDADGAVPDLFREHGVGHLEFALMGQIAGVLGVAEQGKGEGQSELGDGVRRIAGNEGGLDAELFAGGDIDVVIPRGAGEVVFEAVLFEGLHVSGVDVAVAPDHDDLVAEGELDVVVVEIFGAGDQFVAVLLSELLEIRDLIAAAAEANDFLFHCDFLSKIRRWRGRIRWIQRRPRR